MTHKYRSEDKGLLDVCVVKRMSKKKNLICIPLYHGINFLITRVMKNIKVVAFLDLCTITW